jgi:hypothetical protein
LTRSSRSGEHLYFFLRSGSPVKKFSRRAKALLDTDDPIKGHIKN